MEASVAYLTIVLCLISSAFFSGMEIAFISADKLHIEVRRKKGGFSGMLSGIFVSNQSHFLATMLVGNNISLVIYGIFMAKVLESFLVPLPFLNSGGVVLIIESIISTIIVLITAEYLPKSLFLINPNAALRLFAMPMLLLYIMLYPLVWMVLKLSSGIIRIFGFEVNDEKPVFGLTDLNNFIKRNISNKGQDEESEVHAKILNNAIEFKTVKVRECMIPRTEIVAIDVNSSLKELRQNFVDSGHSKIIVYKDSIDEVIGYCHTLELFKKPANIKSILTQIPIVPETMLANELLVQLLTERKSLALVVDEYGGTSGIVSIEDVVEEIFGEIRDEHDDEYLTEDKIDEANFIFSARNEIDYLNEKYSLDLPTGEYDTLGGLIFEFNEDIPSVNDVIEIPSFTITILSMNETRIDNVRLTLIKQEEVN